MALEHSMYGRQVSGSTHQLISQCKCRAHQSESKLMLLLKEKHKLHIYKREGEHKHIHNNVNLKTNSHSHNLLVHNEQILYMVRQVRKETLLHIYI